MEHTEKSGQNPAILKDNSQRAKLAIGVFWIICLVSVLAVASGYMEYELLNDIRDGELVTERQANNNAFRQGFIGILQTGLIVVSGILFLNWFRRLYGNTIRISRTRFEHKESMAVWGFFIPFLSLYIPFQISKENILKLKSALSETASDYRSTTSIPMVVLWWALFIISNYFGSFLFQSVLDENETIADMITTSQLTIISDLIDIPAAIATLIMISKIAKDESALFTSMNQEIRPRYVISDNFNSVENNR